MATLPAFFRRTVTPAGTDALAVRPDPARTQRDPFQLRSLPHEDVIFYCKKIDNSRLVREPDPQSRGACWSAIGAACLMLAVLGGVLAPSLANTLSGYKLEALRVEEKHLTDERRSLVLQEAELLSPERLDKLARGHNLVAPSPNQVVHLDQADSTVAMINQKAK